MIPTLEAEIGVNAGIFTVTYGVNKTYSAGNIRSFRYEFGQAERSGRTIPASGWLVTRATSPELIPGHPNHVSPIGSSLIVFARFEDTRLPIFKARILTCDAVSRSNTGKGIEIEYGLNDLLDLIGRDSRSKASAGSVSTH